MHPRLTCWWILGLLLHFELRFAQKQWVRSLRWSSSIAIFRMFLPNFGSRSTGFILFSSSCKRGLASRASVVQELSTCSRPIVPSKPIWVSTNFVNFPYSFIAMKPEGDGILRVPPRPETLEPLQEGHTIDSTPKHTAGTAPHPRRQD